MNIFFLLQGLTYGLITTFVFVKGSVGIKGKCNDIVSYLKEKNIEYEDNITSCTVNERGDIIEFSYTIGYGEIIDENDLLEDYNSNFDKYLTSIKNLSNLKELYVGYYEQNSNHRVTLIKNLNLPNVKSLKKLTINEMILNQNILDELMLYNNLNEIVMDNVYFDTMENDKLFFSFDKLTNLSKLTLHFSHHRDNYTIETADIKFPKNLEQLSVKGLDIIQDNVDELSSITNLREL
ncbi:hypothetical protein PIROE2DRAFT_6558 [Piromyces sp. E2]|nr:hypothetical protein PIROE2DRAFT_6558 [Piromyces sp. E2]|eukprot:OUM66220.1 hypothetical protein PIROE2DRAFT_6558 [Piromyces sp. E2]